jgi:hypothetical protein
VFGHCQLSKPLRHVGLSPILFLAAVT